MTTEQSEVIKGAVSAFTVTLISLSVTYYFATNGTALHIELPTAIGAVSLPLLYCIGRIANKRFGDESIIKGAAYDTSGSPLAIDKAVLQNTIEQTVLALATYTLIEGVFPTFGPVFLLTLLVLFISGRICFIAGYRKGAGGRAFGFGLTFYPTALTLASTLIYSILV